jgi:DNA-binding response OmpR family regulator
MYGNGQTGRAAHAINPHPAMVLLIDDDPAVRGLLAALLNRDGLPSEAAADGAEAISRLRRNDYDAIILDLMLPELNGFEVLRFLKAERPHLLSRVVVITAATESTLRDFHDGTLVSALLRKPFDIVELSDAVRRCLRRATSAPTAGETPPPTARHPSH